MTRFRSRSGSGRARAGVGAALVLGLVIVPGPAPAQFEEWSPTGSMNAARYGDATITRLCDGRILVAGGSSPTGIQASAELYIPVLGTWMPTGSMSTSRTSHTATLLNDCRVLVAGGSSQNLASAEIYDPIAGTWSPTAPLPATRVIHTANLLPDGRVLVAGGIVGGTSGGATSSVVYDPTAGTWSPTGALTYGRYTHRTVTLANGKVLVAGGTLSGGNAGISAVPGETYAGTGWSLNANQFSPGRWQDYTLTPLEDGRALLLGGVRNWTAIDTDAAHIYDPATNSWTPAAPIPTTRNRHSATLLLDGRVLLAGGNEHPADFGPGTPVATAYVFDPAVGSWSPTGSLGGARQVHLAVRLLDGRVLVAGGTNGTTLLASAEIYTPDPTKLLP